MAHVGSGSGKYRHRLKLERDQGGQETTFGGQPVQSWVVIATRWASIEPLAGRELWQAQQVQADTTHRIKLRFDPHLALTPEDRAVFNNRIFNFLSIKNIEEVFTEWEILAIEAGLETAPAPDVSSGSFEAGNDTWGGTWGGSP